ncbi:Hsp20/alpha crystallin family protein [Tichowtungia aerotolerans]|uniref:Hsp20 family protein n=1 Tax=Tichowtungia aerotolerans TaxID=2697043 RepID=A0A6P1MAH6_9BACT|nr:Hsp20/alpha crystallin family protein [Tichowtungia aerotolerans]QHI69554.1 Hsp20 family protein [Tichowtungia aerotolerans]
MNWPTKRTNSYPAPWNSGLLHRSIDDLLEDFFGGFGIEPQASVVSPRFDVSETEDAIVIEAELPGMDEKDVELTLQDNILTIKGEKKREEETQKKNCYISERSYGHFQRSLQIGSNMDADKVDASFKKGILTVLIPKLEPERSKARTIDIKAA